MSEREPLGVIGVGWVGLVTAACFAELGHEITAVDIDAEKLALLRGGSTPIHEPGLSELLERNLERIDFTTEISDALGATRLLFCCVDTPPTYSGDADLSRVRDVVANFGDGTEHALVMKSTVPVGTGASIVRDVPGLPYVSCPEFLKEGSAIDDFMHPDRVVIGGSADGEWAADAVAAAYGPLGGEIVRTDVASAEMVKLASNAFLATKISFINEIANVSEEVGADVTEVARGMGLDKRIGAAFLRPGIGFGGSCLVGEETVLVRRRGEVALSTLEDLFAAVADDGGQVRERAGSTVLRPDELEVLAWQEGQEAADFFPVAALTRRDYTGDIVEVRTKMGRRVRVTADHPFVTRRADGNDSTIKLAADLDLADWLPLAQGWPGPTAVASHAFDARAGIAATGIEPSKVIVRPAERDVEHLTALTIPDRRAAFGDHPRGSIARYHDVIRSGAMDLDEARRARLSLAGATAGTARNGTYVPFSFELDEAFWRVAGLYIAEGHCSVDGKHRRHRLQWSFHPREEDHLVDEVAEFWAGHGVKASVRAGTTSRFVSVSSKLLARWWLEELGMGANAYEQRLPDWIWSEPEEHKKALLSGAWLGDGSWSFVGGGPSVVLEYGTVSRELADGLLRLLGSLGLVVGVRVGRTPTSTVDTYWLRLSGAEQVERAMFLVPSSDRTVVRESINRQAKRIKPTGSRRVGANTWVRVVHTERTPASRPVYSLEVPGAHTFATTAGLIVHNCFPKDISALKLLAGNSGYHFQLLSAVIEVNELQKRRVVGKLTKHLGSLAGKRIALLGLAFKPDTDDMREASSLVLAARLEGEGASVSGYDPVAAETAGALLPSIELAKSAEEALAGADAAVLVTEWPEFAGLDWSSIAASMATPLIVDGRNFLDPAELRRVGFTYEGIGRPAIATAEGSTAGASDRGA